MSQHYTKAEQLAIREAVNNRAFKFQQELEEYVRDLATRAERGLGKESDYTAEKIINAIYSLHIE